MHDANVENLQILDNSLVLFEPGRNVRRLASTTTDIYQHRMLLKQIPYNKAVIAHLASLIRRDLDAGRRFRVFDCMKVLRAVIVSNPVDRPLPERIVDDLFAVYRALILTAREEVQWCVSRIVRGQALAPEGIQWLLDHWRDSDHVVNRLLRYPKPNPCIRQWAMECYRTRQLASRKSELMALLIDEDIPEFLRQEPADELAWSIFYAHLPQEHKVQLLKTLVNGMTSGVLLDLARRLDAVVLIRTGIKCMQVKLRSV
ncbi:MAG: hypothetical protein HYY00_03570 [Chloroflexi bacterium]|nr:hypothetical protein [Chloroflexota bacterium]